MPTNLLTGESSEAPKGEGDYDYRKSLNNAWPSAKQFADDLTYPIRHPIDTFQGIQSLASGVAQKMATDNPENYSNPQNVLAAEAVGDFYSDRYGGWDEIKRTAEEDPIGIAADLASALTLGLGTAAKIPGKVGNIAGKASKLAAVLDPTTLPTHVAKAIPSRQIYRAGMKFKHNPKNSKVVSRAKAKVLSDKAYDLGITPNDAGADKLARARAIAGDNIDASVSNMPQDGIPTQAIGRYLPEERAEMLRTGKKSKSRAYVDSFDAATEEYMNRVSGQHGDTMTPVEMNNAKIGRYNEATDAAYGGNPKNPADQQANKIMGRGAKEVLEDANPDLRGLNEDYANISRIEDAVPWDESHSVGTDYSARVISGSAGTGQKTAAATGVIAHFLRSRAMSTAQAIKWAGENNIAPLQLRQALLQTGRTAQEIEQETPKNLLLE